MSPTNPLHAPTLFSYVFRYDDGAAPNPYWGICTLVICKPKIRRVAEVGDWIVGLGSSSNPTHCDYSGRIVYVMKVEDKMTMEEYDSFTRDHLPEKIPPDPFHVEEDYELDSWEWRQRLGDSIYDFSERGVPQRGGVHNKKNRVKDRSGQYALLASREFVYFGRNAIPIPSSFEGINHRNQGHRSKLNDVHVPAFLEWWEANRREFATNRVRGRPQWDVFADRENKEACAKLT